MKARSSRVCVRTAVTLIFSRASASPMSRSSPRRSMAVTATDRRGLLRDIGDALAREKINVTAVRTQSRDDLAFMRFTFDVANVAQLKRAMALVRELKGVIRVARG